MAKRADMPMPQPKKMPMKPMAPTKVPQKKSPKR